VDNVLAENENANTARRKHAPSKGCRIPQRATEAPVHSEYDICAE
jgi:hypothetical protein